MRQRLRTRTTRGVFPVILPLTFADIEMRPELCHRRRMFRAVDPGCGNRADEIVATKLVRARDLCRELRLELAEGHSGAGELVPISPKNAPLRNRLRRLAFFRAPRSLVRPLPHTVTVGRERGADAVHLSRDAVGTSRDAVDSMRQTVV